MTQKSLHFDVQFSFYTGHYRTGNQGGNESKKDNRTGIQGGK